MSYYDELQGQALGQLTQINADGTAEPVEEERS